MYLIQIFLPLYSNNGKRFPKKTYTKIRDTLLERYGGLTVYSRTPVVGLWNKNSQSTVRDEILIFEIMAPKLGTTWWRQYRMTLEKIFLQESLVVRAHPIHLL